VNCSARDFLGAWWRGKAGPVPCAGCSACCYYAGVPVDKKRDRSRLPHLLTEGRNGRGGLAASELIVRRLRAGGRRIRTRGPSAKGKATGRHSRQALPSADLNLLVAPPLVRPSPIGNAQNSLSQERDRRFESCLLQRRVNKLSVPLEMMLVEGSIRRARTDWPSGGIARRNAHPHYFTYNGPPATRRRPEGFADAGTCTSQSTARAASQPHLPRRRADSPAPPSRQIKHR